MTDKQRMIEAMKQLREAWSTIIELYEDCEGICLNNEDSNDLYPFEQAMEDYDVSGWVFDTIKVLEDGQ